MPIFGAVHHCVRGGKVVAANPCIVPLPCRGGLGPAGRFTVAGFLALSSLSGAVVAQTRPAAIDLRLRHGPGPLDVSLEWTGGEPTFEVFRSADMKEVCGPDDSLGVTEARLWFDPAPPGTVFYRVHDAAAAEPPETCNGADDDCDGIVDDDATGCDAGGCQDCVAGACRTRCGACEDCVAGACQTRCAPCASCVDGTCGPCDAARCEVCAAGVCRSACDGTRCLACGPGGTCVSLCDTCETCLDGICTDACDRDQCLSCQSGSCRSFCDPVCQTCTPQGCADTCGPCQRCVGGGCHSRCDPDACEACVDGMCRSTCGLDETCVGGVCEPVGPASTSLRLIPVSEPLWRSPLSRSTSPGT